MSVGCDCLEFRVDLVGVRAAGANACPDEAELVEDGQGLLPGVACGVAVANGVVRVAEVVSSSRPPELGDLTSLVVRLAQATSLDKPGRFKINDAQQLVP